MPKKKVVKSKKSTKALQASDNEQEGLDLAKAFANMVLQEVLNS